MTTDPQIPAEVLDEAILAAARAWCQTRDDYPADDYEGAERHLERDARRTAEDPAFRSALAFAAPILYAAGLVADRGRAENAFTRDWPAEWIEAAALEINDCRNDGPQDIAVAVLVALAEAGALQPPGATVREQWATRIAAHGEYDEETCPIPDDAGRDPEQWARYRAEVWRRRFGDDLVSLLRRQQWTGPWREVPIDG